MPQKPRVAILCGGVSPEHQVSLLSAKSIWENIDRSHFRPYIIGIDQKGRFRFYDPEKKWLWHADNPRKVKLAPGWQEAIFLPGGQGKVVLVETREKIKFDVVFPVLHGVNGEDGVIQGLLELAGVPYVGSGVLGSAVAMDKAMTKKLWRQVGLTVLDWLEMTQERIVSFTDVKAKLGLPMFVKPANAGSSVGVNKVKDLKDYQQALKLAFEHDRKVLVERGLDKPREIEIAILEGKDGRLIVSTPGEIRPKHEFYSYEAKYLDPDGAEVVVPALLDDDVIDILKQLAVKSFQAVGARHLARVDLFLTKNGQVYLNEINTMPGFTQISMYPKLLIYDGISYQSIITKLIELALGS